MLKSLLISFEYRYHIGDIHILNLLNGYIANAAIDSGGWFGNNIS